MCQCVIYKIFSLFLFLFLSSSSSFVTLTISPLSHTYPLSSIILLSLLPSSPFCLLFFLPPSNYPYSPPSNPFLPLSYPFSYYPLPLPLFFPLTSSSSISPPLLPLGQLLELHRGQGKEIYWRDGHICPDEQEYREMVRQSECTLFPW